MSKDVVSNPALPFVIPNWEGNALTEKGRFTNIYGDDVKTFADIWKWMRSSRPLTKLKKGQKSPLEVSLLDRPLHKNDNAIIPCGHASFIIDMNGRRILIDPFLLPNRWIKRYTEVPFPIDTLTNVDYILLSHNHRDHIDKESVKAMCKLNPNAVVLTGLGIASILQRWHITNEVQEAGWYQSYHIEADIDIHFLPSHHWSRRWLHDTNKTLWGSFMIMDIVSQKTIFFAGDSGYQKHFSDIGAIYDIDIAMIGIGAYEPEWFMKSAHAGPADGILAFNDLKAKKWIPMHYGTFDLSDEPVYYPEYILKTYHKESLSYIDWMKIGGRMLY